MQTHAFQSTQIVATMASPCLLSCQPSPRPLTSVFEQRHPGSFEESSSGFKKGAPVQSWTASTASSSDPINHSLCVHVCIVLLGPLKTNWGSCGKNNTGLGCASYSWIYSITRFMCRVLPKFLLTSSKFQTSDLRVTPLKNVLNLTNV